MIKHAPVAILFLFIGVVVGISAYEVRGNIVGPSKSDAAFVEACGRLNGEELTLNNIDSLKGKCYLKIDDSTTIGDCKDNHVKNYIDLKNKCGDFYIENKCVESYVKKQYSNLSIDPKGTFAISQGSLDGVWVCRISTINSKIRAVPYYFYD